MEAVGVALDLEALAAPRRRVRRGDRPARAGDLRRRRPRVQPRQPEAARADPLLRAEPAEGQADEDRLLDRRLGPRGPPAGPSDDRQAARVAGLHEAPLDLRRGPADTDGRRRSAAHDVPPGRRGHRPTLVIGPEPPEHPDPDALGRRIRRAFVAGGPGRDARRRGLLPGRAPDPRPRVGRRAPQGRVRPQGRHPPRDRRARPPQGAGPTSPTPSVRWPRWSTSGWPTG